MQELVDYFDKEMMGSLFFMIISGISLLFSIYFLVKVRRPIFNGLAYVFIVLSFIQLTVGIAIYIKSPPLEQKISMAFEEQDKVALDSEKERVTLFLSNLSFYQWTAVALFCVGLLIFYNFNDGSSWKGVGIALGIESIVMLSFNFWASHRNNVYLEFLQAIPS